MVIIKIELGHYYLANKNTFSLFLSSIETQKRAMKESYAWNMYMCFFTILDFLHTNARESLEEHEMPSEHKPETSVLTTFFELS